jgi:hypothetical protein
MLNDNQRHVMRGQTVFTEAQVQRRIQRALEDESLKKPAPTLSKREMYVAVLGQLGITDLNSESTPSSNWSKNGEKDCHPDLIDKERGSLMLGNHTDDELANAVFMYGDRSDHEKTRSLLAGEISSIAYLTAGKERIRWLSRHLELALKKIQELTARVKELEGVPNVIGE